MKTRNFINLILLLLLASCDGCKKEDPKPLTELEKLPPATQEGKNTFGCLVNGKAFLPETSIDAGAVYQSGILQIFGTRYDPFRQFGMVILEKYYGGSLTTTSYPLNKFPDSSCSATFQNPKCDYEPQNCTDGKITLTKIDRVNYIISGIFDFTLAKTGCELGKSTKDRSLNFLPVRKISFVQIRKLSAVRNRLIIFSK